MVDQPNSARARDVAYFLHPYSNLKLHEEQGPLVVTEGRGIYVYDEDGNEYIEGLAGLWCTALGFGEKRLVEAATAEMSRLPFFYSLLPPRPRQGHRPRREAGAIGAGADVQGLLHLVGLGSQRHRDQADLVLQQCTRPARQEEDHQPEQGLSRRHRRHGQPDRARGQPPGLRPADRAHPPRRMPPPLPLRAARRVRGGLRDPAGRQSGAG